MWQHVAKVDGFSCADGFGDGSWSVLISRMRRICSLLRWNRLVLRRPPADAGRPMPKAVDRAIDFLQNGAGATARSPRTPGRA